jgi:NADH-quinone oxidoreductase subunit H
MTKLLSDHYVLVFGIVKILIMLGFFMNMAPLLVWAERRQAALIQDRIGPNRAMIAVPGTALKGAFASPALLAGLAVVALCFFVFPAHPPETGVSRGFWMAQLGVLVLWSHTVLYVAFVRARHIVGNALESFLSEMSEPRWFFFSGLIAHVMLAVAYTSLVGPNEVVAAKAFALGGPAFLAAVLLLIGGYLGARIPSGRVELRAAGIFHSMADAVKAAFKEDFVPPNADKLLHSLAPIIALFPALVTYAIIPFGDALCFAQTPTGIDVSKIADVVPRTPGMCPEGFAPVSLQIADLNVGILYLFAIAGTGIIGAAIAGWSSDNKWSLLGGLRAASQMVSYEVAMGLSIVGAFMVYGSPRLGDMVKWQQENAWGIFVQPLAFFMFLAAAIAEQKRVPFDAPEGESEIIAGYFVEYSSFKFLMFYTGEYIEVITSSALVATIFLGGWTMPFLYRDGIHLAIGDSVVYTAALSHLTVIVLQVLTFFGKVIFLSGAQLFIRWTVPRFRYDQIMAFGWKMLLPASIANLVVTGLVILVLDHPTPGIASTLKVVADLTHWVVALTMLFLVVRFVMLVMKPIDRTRYVGSTSAARVARLGGVKDTPMQALSLPRSKEKQHGQRHRRQASLSSEAHHDDGVVHPRDREGDRRDHAPLLQEHEGARAGADERSRARVLRPRALDDHVSGAEAPVLGAFSRAASPDHPGRRLAAVRGVSLLLHGVPRAVHPHRRRRVPRGGQAPRLRALPRGVRDRRAPVRLLRVLRGSVPVRRDPHGHRAARGSLRLARPVHLRARSAHELRRSGRQEAQREPPPRAPRGLCHRSPEAPLKSVNRPLRSLHLR